MLPQRYTEALEIIKTAQKEHLELVKECDAKYTEEISRQYCREELGEEADFTHLSDIERDYAIEAYEEYRMSLEAFKSLLKAYRDYTAFHIPC